MTVQNRFAIRNIQPFQPNNLPLPEFHTPEQFIQDCRLLLQRNVSPNQILHDNTSLNG